MEGTILQAEMIELLEQRDRIDNEISLLLQQPFSQLSSNLTDSKGFPRADIDYSVEKAARDSRISELRNRRKAISDKINQNNQVLKSANTAATSSSVKRASSGDALLFPEFKTPYAVHPISPNVPASPGTTQTTELGRGKRSKVDNKRYQDFITHTTLESESPSMPSPLPSSSSVPFITNHPETMEGTTSTNLRGERLELLAQSIKIIDEKANIVDQHLSQLGERGCTANLTDSKGCARSDADNPAARRAWHRLAELNNEHKVIMDKIDQNKQVLRTAKTVPTASRVKHASEASADVLGSLVYKDSSLSSRPRYAGTKRSFAKVQGIPEACHAVQSGADVLGSSVYKDSSLSSSPRYVGTSRPFANGIPETCPGGEARADVFGSSVYKDSSLSPRTMFSVPRYAGSIRPFAEVLGIPEACPAAEDGLQVGDLIVKFGDVVYDGREGVLQRAIAEARRNEGHAVPTAILRQGVLVNLQVTPRAWIGEGLLGCEFRGI